MQYLMDGAFRNFVMETGVLKLLYHDFQNNLNSWTGIHKILYAGSKNLNLKRASKMYWTTFSKNILIWKPVLQSIWTPVFTYGNPSS